MRALPTHPETFSNVDHDANIGVTGHNIAMEAAFIATAEAILAILSNPIAIRGNVAFNVSFAKNGPECALATSVNR